MSEWYREVYKPDAMQLRKFMKEFNLTGSDVAGRVDAKPRQVRRWAAIDPPDMPHAAWYTLVHKVTHTKVLAKE